MFDNLFYLDSNGKVQKSLAKSYKIYEDDEIGEYKMIIDLKETAWSDGTALLAQDVVDAWRRILNVANSFDAAVLLYDIKNAKLAKEGEVSIDDVGISALNDSQVEIYFTGKIDYDQFLLRLTSYALAPIRETIIDQPENIFDWAKKPTIFAASGPFKLREVSYEKGAEKLVLERNSYYFRNIEKDKLDKSVKPYRLIVDFSKSAEEIMQLYANGELFYVGNIPLSVRGAWADQAEITDALSTHSYMINENTVVRYYDEAEFAKLSTLPETEKELVEGVDGEKIFANTSVRKALSLAIDREAIAKKVVFAKAATGLVPNGVFNTDSKKKTFRDAADPIIATTAKLDEAKALLSSANVDASKFMFTISVPAYDDVHMAIANEVKAAWTALGIHVEVLALDVIVNTHIDTVTGAPIDGVRDDIFAERYASGKFEVAAIDYTALSADAFSVLAPFAYGFTGGAAIKENSPEFNIPTHISGYNSEAYNTKINAAYAEKDTAARATILHDAEKLLLEDMPIIPIVFNQNATLTSKSLSKDKVSYYGTPIFTKLKLKNYENHLPEE
jgi:oligopeptide transport system substrate-binding protein